MSWPFISEPDLCPLKRALAKCGVAAEQIPQTAERLSRPPVSFGQSISADPEPGATIQLGGGKQAKLATRKRPFDRDMAARMLRLNEARPEPDATWKTLSRAERKRAERLWDWTGEAHGLSVTPQGRPPVIDPALVLYCIRVLCEATGWPRFQFSRSGAQAPGGPMLRALIEALPLAQSFLAYRFPNSAIARISTKNPSGGKIGDHAEAISEIVRATRSERFKTLCQTLTLGTTAEDVAANPAMFRVIIAYGRKLPSQKPARRR